MNRDAGAMSADLAASKIGTESAQTGHRLVGIVTGVGGGTTPRPYRVGAETASAGFDAACGGKR
jgi:hypothetical protein